MKTRFHITQLGVRPGGSMRVVLSGLPREHDEIAVLLESGYDRGTTSSSAPEDWTSRRFTWPFGPFDVRPQRDDASPADDPVVCRRESTRWGDYWIGMLPRDVAPGLYHLRVAGSAAVSAPFEIGRWIHDRLVGGYLDYARAQRAGQVLPGCRSPLFLDDAVLEGSNTPVIAQGGWFDAGDHRQWTSTTALHLGALTDIAIAGPRAWRERARDELEWGRDYFTHLCAGGQVPDNVGGGALPAEYQDRDWWFENHSGTACDGSGSRPTDESPGTGDERTVRVVVNEHAYYVLIRELATSWHVGEPVRAARARTVAEQAWRTAAAFPPAGPKTLFLASRLRAAVALRRLPVSRVDDDEVESMVEVLLARQHHGHDGDAVRGYFLEGASGEPFRSIPYSCEPAFALLDAAGGAGRGARRSRAAVSEYIDGYLLADAESNPFGLPPYGVYDLAKADIRQTFRRASEGRGVRTFMAPRNEQSIVHGTSAVAMHQSYLLARAGVELERPDWLDAAERVLQWASGANPEYMSLFVSLGYHRPVPFSPRLPNLPGAVVNGHIGWPDDTPYLETSDVVNWNTQEVYGVPTTYAAQAALWLSGRMICPLHTAGDDETRWL